MLILRLKKGDVLLVDGPAAIHNFGLDRGCWKIGIIAEPEVNISRLKRMKSNGSDSDRDSDRDNECRCELAESAGCGAAQAVMAGR